MIAGTLPGPTPKAGFPELYAARTMSEPPVARITAVFRWRISSCVPSSVGADIASTRSRGAPARSAASAMIRTASSMHFTARGCGHITIALRPFTLISAL